MDLSRIDLTTLPPEQWEPLKAEVRRRAHAERAQMLRAVFARLRGWIGGRMPRPRLAGDDIASAYKRPLYFGGRM
jgi:hypothetical protein